MRIIFLTLIVFLLIGCGKAKPISQSSVDKIVATVNSEPIYIKEVKLALALKVKNDPSFKVTSNTLNELLDEMIDERLRLQAAEKSKSDIKIYTELLKY